MGSWHGQFEDRRKKRGTPLAREIEARRTGVYVLSDAERAVIADARKDATGAN